MRSGRAMIAIGLVAVLSTGCVDRRFIIESNVPNAQVYIDNKPVGAAPADAPFDYYGYYNVTLVHPDFAPKHQRVRVRPPWYAYPPIDFFAEVLWPLRIEDTRRMFLKMEPSVQIPPEVLAAQADLLRQRGYALPEPPPGDHSSSVSRVPPPPPVMPNGTLLPTPAPLPPEGIPSALPLPERPPLQ